MLSRFALCGGQTVKNCFLKLQPASAITTSSSSSANNPAVLDEFPPPSSKRDHANFARPVLKESPPPVRLGFLPDTWFKFFYPKTGYTGPYMFLISVGTYLYSKEIIVHEHNMVHAYAFILACIVVHQKFGDKIGEAYNKMLAEEYDLLDGSQEKAKEEIKELIGQLEAVKPKKDAILELTKARTEIIQLQMESAFRDRIVQTYKQVKDRLDCQAELDNAERRIKQKNLMDYVLQNVMKSITPDLEKNALQACINDLNALSAKA